VYDSMQDLHNTLTEERDLLKKLIKSLQTYNRKLAEAEFEYRKALTSTCFLLKTEGYSGEIDGEYREVGETAWTVTTTLARGIPEVAEKRLERDTVEGEKEAIQQKIFQVKIEINLLETEMEAIRRGE